MRGHVQGVARQAGDLCVGPRRGERQPGMVWVVIAVDEVVERPRMIGVPGQHLLEEGGRRLLGLASHERVLVLVVLPLGEREGLRAIVPMMARARKLFASRSSGFACATSAMASAYARSRAAFSPLPNRASTARR